MSDAGERAREIVDKWWGLPDYIKVPPVEYEKLVAKIAAALTALETANAELRDRPTWRVLNDLRDERNALLGERDALKAEVERLREELDT